MFKKLVYYFFKVLHYYTDAVSTIVICKLANDKLLSFPIKGVYSSVQAIVSSKLGNQTILTFFQQEVPEQDFLQTLRVEFSLLSYSYILVKPVKIKSEKNEDKNEIPRASDSHSNN